MKDRIKLKYAWKLSFASLIAILLVSGGLFLNLGAVRATEATPTPTPSATPSVSPSPSSSPTPSATPTVTPSPETATPPSFPKCIDQSGTGNLAHYESGSHQIVGNGLLNGKDDVYSLANGNAVQCFVPPNKDVCIQTNWWKTDAVLEGWYSVNGSQWNLGNFHYLAKNLNYNCVPEPSPTPTPTPVACTTCGSTTNITINNNNEQKQEQHQEQTGTVAGVKTPTKSPETGVGVLGMAGMFSAAPIGILMSRFGKGRIAAKKEEDINEIALGIVNSKRGKSNE